MFTFNPHSPEFRRNPYPIYAALRAHAPIYFWEAGNSWFLTGWTVCNDLLRDNRFGNGPGGVSMLFQNPPDHTRLRALVQKAFTPRRVEQLRGKIQSITDGLLDQVTEKAQRGAGVDLVADFAYPLPVAVIVALLGVPAADHAKFHRWSQALVDSLDLLSDPSREPQISAANSGFRAYFDELIAERRAHPGDDLLSALIAAEEAGDRLTANELYFNARLLLVAGYETTVGLIGNGTLALLRQPDQLARLQANPGLIGNAVEELLRFDSPIQMVGRTALEDVEFHGQQILQGQSVGIMVGAANHDPARFAHPGQLQLDRPNVQHLSFGGGIHYCLGAPLARLEGQIALQTLFQRFPHMRLVEAEPPHRDNYVFRSLVRLPVIL
ncbi:MAG: cytochrome P450 [Caldilineaceae bacterium]|nr:cytochrome P450 [Caldilineaceae bacterium]